MPPEVLCARPAGRWVVEWGAAGEDWYGSGWAMGIGGSCGHRCSRDLSRYAWLAGPPRGPAAHESWHQQFITGTTCRPDTVRHAHGRRTTPATAEQAALCERCLSGLARQSQLGREGGA